MRAAEYVRVSTDLQQYSIANQQEAIAKWAAQHQFEIVKTYADPAKSGLDIKHRQGLQSLIDDVLGGRADFQAVIVFDVSRWGRFQDSDEAACYEFLCRRAGIQIHYCAELFLNDGSMASDFFKMVKRTMAAEYIRELSAKVHAGQCRLAANGFKLGGKAGYGLRRLLLDSKGRPKMVLKDGERKSLTTDRVTYTFGPQAEVDVVREIFSMYLDQNFSMGKISRVLNERGVKTERCGAWDTHTIRYMLAHPKYAGCIVFNRCSSKFKSKITRNPREQWVLRPNAFPAIVSQERLNAAKAKIDNQVFRRSNEQLLGELKTYIAVHGKPMPRPKPPAGLASAQTYAKRFGGLLAAYELIVYRSKNCTWEKIATTNRLSALRRNVSAELGCALSQYNLNFQISKRIFSVQGCGHFRIVTGRDFITPLRPLRWRVTLRHDCSDHSLIVVRLQEPHDTIKDFVILVVPPVGNERFVMTERLVQEAGTVCQDIRSVAEAIAAMSSEHKGNRRSPSTNTTGKIRYKA